MHGARGKAAAIGERAFVGDEFHRDAARVERMRQRFGRKQMAAGAAGGEKDRASRSCQAAAAATVAGPLLAATSVRTRVRGRLRVTASRKPMPSDSEISDEPP